MTGVQRASPEAAAGAAELVAHLDALYAFARQLAGSRAQADDLVQETYVRALRALVQFAPGSNLRAWLFRILRNAWVDSARAARRHPPDEAVVHEWPDAGLAEGHAALRGDETLEPLRRLVAEEIDAALGAISADARMVVLLDVQGFTESEIADVMACAVGTVKSRLARARALLRERLAEYQR